jgi:hypothetical protein
MMRCLNRWPGYEPRDFDSFENCISADLSTPTLAGVLLNGAQFDLLTELHPESEVLLFFFQGAVDREKAPQLPNFTGVSLMREAKISKIYLSDPSLYLDHNLRLAWYAGHQECDVRALTNLVVQGFIDRLKPKKVIFIGGSGGGLAALWTSSFFPESLAIVWNPQTNIVNYSRSHVEDFSRICYGVEPEKISDFIEPKVSSRYAGGVNNYILYMQNSLDWHVQSHMKPFLADIGLKTYDANCSIALSERVFLYKSSDWGDGHTAPPLLLLKKIITIALSPHSVENIFWRSRFAV